MREINVRIIDFAEMIYTLHVMTISLGAQTFQIVINKMFVLCVLKNPIIFQTECVVL